MLAKKYIHSKNKAKTNYYYTSVYLESKRPIGLVSQMTLCKVFLLLGNTLNMEHFYKNATIGKNNYVGIYDI